MFGFGSGEGQVELLVLHPGVWGGRVFVIFFKKINTSQGHELKGTQGRKSATRNLENLQIFLESNGMS